MRDFFESWRRKVGCATLVMACVFAAGWLRSMSIADSLISRTSLFVSFKGDVVCQILLGQSDFTFSYKWADSTANDLWHGYD